MNRSGHRWSRRLPEHKPLSLRAAAPVLVLVLWLVFLLSPIAAADEPRGARWSVALDEFEDEEYASATGFTVLHMAPSGEILIVGLENGGVLFLETETGEVVARGHTGDHGAVVSISSDDAGQRAVFVYEDGYVAALDTDQNELLMTRFSQAGAPADLQGHVAAKMSPDGEHLVLSTDELEVYRFQGEPPEASFEVRVEGQEQAIGPYLYIHPNFPFFAAMNVDGQTQVFDFNLQPMTTQGRLHKMVGPVAALAASHDGKRLAIVEDDGTVLRYEISFDMSNPQNSGLVLDYEGKVRCSIPTCDHRGVALNTDGTRLMAWTNQEIVWVEGRNAGDDVSEEELAETRRDTVRLKPPAAPDRYGQVTPDQELTRALITRVEGDGSVVPIYRELPSTSRSTPPLGEDIHPRLLALAGVHGLAFTTQGTQLSAFPVDATPASALPKGNPDNGSGLLGTSGLFEDGTWLVGLAGLGLLVLVGLLLVVLFVARRRDDPRLLSELELEEGALSAPASARPSLPGGGRRGQFRAVAPSAPAQGPPPEGLLVLHDYRIAGHPPIRDLRLALTRPGVVRLQGEKALLARLTGALMGEIPSAGVAAAGGADRRSTPLLFMRHLRVGLGAPPDAARSPRALYKQLGTKRGVPGAVVERRLEVDLGWMGERLDRRFAELASLDQWKVRLALAFLDRPRVLMMWNRELPEPDDAQDAATVRTVLAAVARHYRAAVLLLDPGGPVPQRVMREWSHEEFRLTPTGIRDRLLLENGEPVGMSRTVGQKLDERGAANGAYLQNGDGKKSRLPRFPPRARATRKK